MVSPCSFEKSLRSFACSAEFMSLFGTKWSGTSTMRFLLNTFFAPAFLNSRMDIGAVMSFARTISTFAFISSPGTTSFFPQ